jgi:lysophospholipase L1-like esterase
VEDLLVRLHNPAMKPSYFALLLAVFVGASSLLAQAPPAAPPASSARPAHQAPAVAAPKLGREGQPDVGFLKRHEAFVQIAKKGDVDLVFLGDSITDGWNGQKEIWNKAFGAYKPANFGIGGDRTQHVLWRISNGELDGMSPKAAVLMIGTNNSGSDPAEDIAAGIKKIVETIHSKSPRTKVLLLAVFPRGEKPNPQREKLKTVNSSIAKLDNGKDVFYLDIGDKFLQPDDLLTKEIMPDFLHLSAKGYQIWADAIAVPLERLMKS